MIPKIIHYGWFGGKSMPELANSCMESWKKHCKGYEIIEWNEQNFDVNMARYSKEAAQVGKWAFVADVLRFYTIYTYGGIYLDVDIELLKPFDELLNAGMFIGFESDKFINSGQGFGAVQHHPLVKKMLDIYTELPFINSDGTLNLTPSPKYTSKIMSNEGFVLNNTRQSISDIELYPKDYFCPKDWITCELEVTSNTYSIHHFLASWWTEEEKRKHEANIKFERVAKRFKRANQY